MANTPDTPANTPIEVLFVLQQHSLVLDWAGPAEALRIANQLLRAAGQPERFQSRFAGAAPQATGPTPGPPPPCGMAKVLCKFRCDTSPPNCPGAHKPTIAFMFAPSI